MHEVRYLTPADDQLYGRVGGYSYNLQPHKIVEMLERNRGFGDRPLGAFGPGGELGAAMIDRRMQVNINGRDVPANGVGMVASAPESRRRGMVRDMLAWHLSQLNDDGVALSILYPFQYRFYQRLGWGFANQVVVVGVPPKEFAGHGRESGAMVCLVTLEPSGLRFADGYTKEQVIGLLQPIYEATARNNNLAAWRDPADWDRALRVSTGVRYIYGWFSPAGKCEAYFFGGTRNDDYPTTLYTREMFASTPDGWRGLFWFLSCHDSHIKLIEFILPARSQILELLVAPRHDAKLAEGQMARIVNVPRMLSMRGCGDVADGRCVLRVRDELAPWNDGDFILETAAGTTHAVKAKSVGAAGEPDVTATIDVLSQMAIGTRSLEEMARFGLVDVNAGPGYNHSAALFQARPIWHLEYY
jgi:predicted acetyltransferase